MDLLFYNPFKRNNLKIDTRNPKQHLFYITILKNFYFFRWDIPNDDTVNFLKFSIVDKRSLAFDNISKLYVSANNVFNNFFCFVYI